MAASSTERSWWDPIQIEPVKGYESAAWEKVFGAEKIRNHIGEALKGLEFPIYLSGLTGTGKSSIASLIYMASRYPIWRRADTLMVTLATQSTKPEGRQELHKIMECSCLFLDDIFFRDYTAPMQQALFDILENRRGKPIVMTSNICVEDIPKRGIDDRISSRILAGCEIYLSGSDRRTESGRKVSING